MRFSLAVSALVVVAQTGYAQVANHVPSQIQVERLRAGLNAAPQNMIPRPLNSISLELIKHFEGWSSIPYNDSAGYCTIGYGHLLALKRCSQIDLGPYKTGINKEQGLKILEKDTELARVAVQKNVSADLSSDEFGALTSFVFNLGEGSLTGSTLYKLLKIDDRGGAAKQFKRWIRAGNEVAPGLVIRRRCEATLFVSQLSVGRRGQFDRNRCINLGIAPSGETIDILKGEQL